MTQSRATNNTNTQTMNNCNGIFNKNNSNNNIFRFQVRHLRPHYTLPKETKYDATKNVHSSQGAKPNYLQRVLLHLARKTSYADVFLYMVYFLFVV